MNDEIEQARCALEAATKYRDECRSALATIRSALPLAEQAVEAAAAKLNAAKRVANKDTVRQHQVARLTLLIEEARSHV